MTSRTIIAVSIAVISLISVLLIPGTAGAAKQHKSGLAVPLQQPPDFVEIRSRRLALRNDLGIVRHDKGSMYHLYHWTVGNELYRAWQDPEAVFGAAAYPFVITEVCLPLEFPSPGRITLAADISTVHYRKGRPEPGEIITISQPREIRIPHSGAFLLYIPLDTPLVISEPFFAGVFIRNQLAPHDSIALFLDHTPVPQTCFNYWGSPEVWIDMNDFAYCDLPGRLVLFSAGRPAGGLKPTVTCRAPRDTTIFLCEPQTIRLAVSAHDQNRRPAPLSLVEGPGHLNDRYWEYHATSDAAFTVRLAATNEHASDTADFHVRVRFNRPPHLRLPGDTTFSGTSGQMIQWHLDTSDPDRNLFDVYLTDGPGRIVDKTWRVALNDTTAGSHRLVIHASDYCRQLVTDTITVHLELLPAVIAAGSAVEHVTQTAISVGHHDLNGDGSINIVDLQLLAAFILFDGPVPQAGAAACDIDGDQRLTPADIIAFRRLLFADQQTAHR
jgi:hypothetical protein